MPLSSLSLLPILVMTQLSCLEVVGSSFGCKVASHLNFVFYILFKNDILASHSFRADATTMAQEANAGIRIY